MLAEFTDKLLRYLQLRQAAHGNGSLGSRANWEKYHQNQSRVMVTGQDPPEQCSIEMINGVATSPRGAVSNARYLQEKVGLPSMALVYNPTGGFLTDLVEALMGLFGVITPPVRRLHQLWDAYLDANPGSDLLQIAHSQGCIHVRNALISYDEEKRKRIQVVAIAPAAYIHQSICGYVKHYCCDRDLVPRLDIWGRVRCQDDTEILTGRGNGMHHGFQDPIYVESIENEVNRFNGKPYENRDLRCHMPRRGLLRPV